MVDVVAAMPLIVPNVVVVLAVVVADAVEPTLIAQVVKSSSRHSSFP